MTPGIDEGTGEGAAHLRAVRRRAALLPAVAVVAVLALGACSEEPTFLEERPPALAVMKGRVTMEDGSPPIRFERPLRVGGQGRDPDCTGSLTGLGGDTINLDGTYEVLMGVPAVIAADFGRRRWCVTAFLGGFEGDPWRPDTVPDAGVVTLRFREEGVPLDTLEVDFVARLEDTVPEGGAGLEVTDVEVESDDVIVEEVEPEP